MIMKKIYILSLAALILGSFSASAIRAKKGFREFQQPDGSTVKAELVGDESFHYYVTEDGLPLTSDAEGTLRYVKVNAQGEISLSPMAASIETKRSAEAKKFVSDISLDASVRALYNAKMKTGARKASALPQSGMGLYSTQFPRTGNVKGLVILVQYADVPFTHPDPAQYFHDLLNKSGFSEYGGTGSARDYFLDQSNGKFIPQFDVYGPITLPKNRKYYGGNVGIYGDDNHPEEMIVDGCKLLDDEIDFSQYDLDNDGYVDNVFVFYAGQGEASYGPAESVWPHSWELKQAGKMFELDGKKINKYACTNEWEQNKPDGIGTFVHEFSHVMGLPDLYHTLNANANYTPDAYSVLDYGPYNNDSRTPPNYSIYERNAMGWIEPMLIDGPDDITLNNIADSNEGCIVQTDKVNEFYLFENRQMKGWDKYIPYHGMLIWHIDFVQSVFDSNIVNNTSTHQYVDIVEAGGSANSASEITKKTYPWPGTLDKTTFTASTTPAFKSWSGKAIDLPITDIQESADGVISFKVAGGRIDLDAPTGLSAEGATDGTATLSWNPVENATSYKVSLYTKDDSGNPASYVVKDQECENTSLSVSGLKSEERYYFTVCALLGYSSSDPSDEEYFDMPEIEWIYVIPATLPASDLSDNGFTALWEAVPHAESYLLTVCKETFGEEKTSTYGFGSESELEIPEGWTWSGTSSDVYGPSSTGYFGESAPALKFATDGRYLISGLFEGPVTKVSFWERTASGSASAPNTLTLEGRASVNDSWTEIESHSPSLDSKGATVTINNIPSDVRQIRLIFTKNRGNLALDDLSVTFQSKSMVPVEGYNEKNVGNTTSHEVVVPMGDGLAYTYNVVALNAAGVRSAISDSRNVPEADTSGIDSAVTSALRFAVSGRTVSVSGANSGDVFRLFNAYGVAITTVVADSAGSVEITCPATGLYILSGPAKAFKFIAN